jgi:hypothetical protein
MEPDLTDLLENTPEPERRHYPRTIWKSGFEIHLSKLRSTVGTMLIQGQMSLFRHFVIQGKHRNIHVAHSVMDKTEEIVIQRLIEIGHREKDKVTVETTKQNWIQDPE